MPMAGDDTIRAVTYWNWSDRVEGDWHRRRNIDPNSFRGINWVVSAFDSAGVPDGTGRILIQIDRLIWIRDSVYGGNTLRWQQDFPKECKRYIAHEFGHSVGMQHVLRDCNATAQPLPLMGGTCWIADSIGYRMRIGDSTFSDQSKDEFSVREER